MNKFHRFQNFRQFSNLFSQIWLKKRHTSLFSRICREIRTKFHQKFAENMQNSTQKKSEIHLFIREKMLTILAEFLRSERHCVSCPEDACPKRLSWFFYSIPKVQKWNSKVQKCVKNRKKRRTQEETSEPQVASSQLLLSSRAPAQNRWIFSCIRK